MAENFELPEGYDWDALERCRELFFDQIEHPDRVTITLTSAFEKTVKELIEDQDYAEVYERHRPMAFALAKTIPQADGTTRLVVDIDLFLEDAPYGRPEETFAHEALHIRTDERSENLSDLRLRHKKKDLPHYTDFIAMAGVACEEYRVERALWVNGERQRSEHLSGADYVGKIFYNEVRKACRQYHRDLDVFAVAKVVTQSFHALVTSTAYIAAELGSSPTAPKIAELDGELDQLVFGESWRLIIAKLQLLPPADVPTPRKELDKFAFDVVVSLEAWLEAIGFIIKSRDEENAHFEIMRPWQWELPGFDVKASEWSS